MLQCEATICFLSCPQEAPYCSDSLLPAGPFTFTPPLASVVLTFITSAAQSCPVVGLRKSTAAGVPGWAFIFLTENFFLV